MLVAALVRSPLWNSLNFLLLLLGCCIGSIIGWQFAFAVGPNSSPTPLITYLCLMLAIGGLGIGISLAAANNAHTRGAPFLYAAVCMCWGIFLAALVAYALVTWYTPLASPPI